MKSLITWGAAGVLLGLLWSVIVYLIFGEAFWAFLTGLVTLGAAFFVWGMSESLAVQHAGMDRAEGKK